MEQQSIKVIIVDDHDMVRVGLKVSIETMPNLEYAGGASNGAEAVQLYQQINPDIVLMDLLMPVMDGVQATKEIMAYDPNARIIGLTSYDDEGLIHKALEAGVTSYLLKDVSMDKLTDAIKDAYNGKPTLAQEATQALIRAASRPPERGHDLTPSELRVLDLVTRGQSNGEIAQQLVISTSTVKKHVSSILAKLEVSNRAEAAAFAIQHELVTVEN